MVRAYQLNSDLFIINKNYMFTYNTTIKLSHVAIIFIINAADDNLKILIGGNSLKEKHIFAGNNTGSGFYSCFEFIFNPLELSHIYILKGGPGVGKSSFMKKFASEMNNQNLSVEYIHCSSDNESLDGIIIPELNIAFVDGTAPHAIDPSIPGAVDEIVNLGAFLNNGELQKHKNQIIQINRTKSQLYKSAYRYLHAADIISEEINYLNGQFINKKKFDEMCNEAISKLFYDDVSLNKNSNIKKMFLEAYTANGYISRTADICQDKRIWSVIGENTNYTSDFLRRLANEAEKKGYDLELYLMPLNPDKLQHIYIPEMNLLAVSSESREPNDFEEIFDIHGITDTDNLKAHISEIENNLHLQEILIKNALKKLSETKKYHELLEIFYINNMDFSSLDECFNSILKQYT